MDCIAAISTPMGVGGIGIIRVSGTDTIEVVEKIFKGKDLSSTKSHSILYGHIVYEGEIVDECLVMVMKAPNTYTKEDVVEINCHGGIKSVQNVLHAVLKSGATMAAPGEFTKRAFLNGRIDLSQAEAVIDIINSNTDLSLQGAIKQLDGALSEKIGSLRNDILGIIAHIEVTIDYPEHEDITEDTIKCDTKKIAKDVKHLLDTFDHGKILKEGISTVILGKPNVGKSSLMNLILNEDRAIVTDISGTTRDILKEYVNINGIPIKLYDTAGIRETENIIEKIGIERSKSMIDECDLVILVFDGSRELSQEDLEIINLVKDQKVIAVINKTDLKMNLDVDKLVDNVENYIKISVKEKSGIDQLYDLLNEMFFSGQINMDDSIFISNIRHRDALYNTLDNLLEAERATDSGIDFASIYLTQAYGHLGEITGDTVDEDIIDRIFADFCLGK